MKIVNEDFHDVVDKVKATYDYYNGKRTNKLGNLQDATAEEIKKNKDLYKIATEFNKANAPYRVQVDRHDKKLLMQFNSDSVPKNLVNKFDTKAKTKDAGIYAKYVNNYDHGTVDLIFDAKELPDYKDYGKDIRHKDGTKGVIGTRTYTKKNESIGDEDMELEPIEDLCHYSIEVNGNEIDTYDDEDEAQCFFDDLCSELSDYDVAYLYEIDSDGDRDCISAYDPEGEHADRSYEEYKDSKMFDEGKDYGGAYDVDPEMLFTRDDLLEFGDQVCEAMYLRGGDYSLSDVSIDPSNNLTISVEDSEGNTFSTSVKIDLRKVPRYDLASSMYVSEVSSTLLKQDTSIITESLSNDPDYTPDYHEKGFRHYKVLYDLEDGTEDLSYDCVAKDHKQAASKFKEYAKNNIKGTPINAVSKLDESVKTEGNTSLKANHICSGCGKPIGECTCKINEEELDESVNKKIHYSSVKSLNGSKVVESNLSSEHKEYKGSYIGYVYYETEDGNTYYYPTDLKGNLINDINAWDFIKKLPDIEYGELNEEISSSATQSSSVGQHKRSSIDLIPKVDD